MRFLDTPITGVWIVEPDPRGDERGFFARLWCEQTFAAHGLNGRFVQCNNAFSRYAGTVRGMHGQAAPHAEVKLMRCVRGALFDVVVDVRPESASYLRWFGVELNAENRRMLYVPPGCAHGYQALLDDTEVIYPVSAPYTPAAEYGLRWNDPQVAIVWPRPVVHVSPKDAGWPDWSPGRPVE